MPTTFRDFVKLAGRMGPAQPLAVRTDRSHQVITLVLRLYSGVYRPLARSARV